MENLQEIHSLKEKYAFVTKSLVAGTPHKYLPQQIRELCVDIGKVTDYRKTNNDVKSRMMCDDVESFLVEKKLMFETKLKNIPNKHYMEESDEEWIDENKPA